MDEALTRTHSPHWMNMGENVSLTSSTRIHAPKGFTWMRTCHTHVTDDHNYFEGDVGNKHRY
jgi:hypothetical protein